MNVAVEITYEYANHKLTTFMKPRVVRGINEDMELILEDVDVVKEDNKYTLFVPEGTLILAYVKSGSYRHSGQLWAIIRARNGVEGEKVSAPYTAIKVNNADILVATAKHDREPTKDDADPTDIFTLPSEISKQIGKPVKAGSQTLAAWLVANNIFKPKLEANPNTVAQEIVNIIHQRIQRYPTIAREVLKITINQLQKLLQELPFE